MRGFLTLVNIMNIIQLGFNAMKKTKTPKKEVIGFLYRGLYTEATIGGAKVRLVQNETYVIPDMKDPKNIVVTLKNSRKTLTLTITAKEYYQYLSSGRSGYKDNDPYL